LQRLLLNATDSVLGSDEGRLGLAEILVDNLLPLSDLALLNDERRGCLLTELLLLLAFGLLDEHDLQFLTACLFLRHQLYLVDLELRLKL
jgi:hypothetical protein